MIYFSSLLYANPIYRPAGDRLCNAVNSCGIPYSFLKHTNDIWVRDFMPVKTRSGKYVSFRYEPSYLVDYPQLKTDFRVDINEQLPLERIVYSDINLDGGNVVFSPSKTKAVISDRVFTENENYAPAELIQELERLMEAQIIIIPSLRSEMTGHADGMVRFISENVAIGNVSHSAYGLEAKIRKTLRNHGIEMLDFPYFSSSNDSAVGCYLNYLETAQHLFLPVFGVQMDREAITSAESIFQKTIVPVVINEIAEHGGVLNCISWEC